MATISRAITTISTATARATISANTRRSATTITISTAAAGTTGYAKSGSRW